MGDGVRPSSIIIVDSAVEIEHPDTPSQQDPIHYPCYVFVAVKQLGWTTATAMAIARAGGSNGFNGCFWSGRASNGRAGVDAIPTYL